MDFLCAGGHNILREPLEGRAHQSLLFAEAGIKPGNAAG